LSSQERTTLRTVKACVLGRGEGLLQIGLNWEKIFSGVGNWVTVEHRRLGGGGVLFFGLNDWDESLKIGYWS